MIVHVFEETGTVELPDSVHTLEWAELAPDVETHDGLPPSYPSAEHVSVPVMWLQRPNGSRMCYAIKERDLAHVVYQNFLQLQDAKHAAAVAGDHHKRLVRTLENLGLWARMRYVLTGRLRMMEGSDG